MQAASACAPAPALSPGLCCLSAWSCPSSQPTAPMEAAGDAWPGTHRSSRPDDSRCGRILRGAVVAGQRLRLLLQTPLTSTPGRWEPWDGLHRPMGTSGLRWRPPGHGSKLSSCWQGPLCANAELGAPRAPGPTRTEPGDHTPRARPWRVLRRRGWGRPGCWVERPLASQEAAARPQHRQNASPTGLHGETRKPRVCTSSTSPSTPKSASVP